MYAFKVTWSASPSNCRRRMEAASAKPLVGRNRWLQLAKCIKSSTIVKMRSHDVVHLRQFEQDSRFHPDRRDQCPGSLIPRFQLRGAGMTPHHSTTRLKFGTVGNSFQRSPRLGKLLEVAAFLQIQLFSISRFSNIKQSRKDLKIKSAWKHMMDVSKGAPLGCPTLRYHPGDHGVQTLLLKWPSWPWHATGM